MIRAITFDFWDTLVIDGSDEPKRAARGLVSKAKTRLQLLTAEITQYHPQIRPKQVQDALDHADKYCRYQWKVNFLTPTVSSRLQEAYAYLKIERTPGFNDTVREIEEMRVNIPPDFVPGVQTILAELAQDYTLGIISDTIHTPGRGLRQLLEKEGLLSYFSYCIFSDEVGVAKPAPAIFERAASELGVPLTQIVHIGDRENNDIAGPLAMGMPAILYTGVVDRNSATTRAIAICRDHAELPALIKQVAEGEMI